MLSVRHFTTLASAVLSLAFATQVNAGVIDAVQGYDVFVDGNFVIKGSHVHGATAVGGNLTLSGNMSEFANHGPSNPGVTVAGNIVLNANGRINGNGKLEVGSLTSGQSINGSQDLVKGTKKLEAQQATVGPVDIDFDAAFDELTQLSATYAQMSATLALNSLTSGGNFNYTFGATAAVEYLNITGSQLASLSNLNFNGNAAPGASLVINVDLSGYSGGAFTQNRNGGNQANNILWNFYGASSVTLKNQFIGTILAPEMSVKHINNDIKGMVIAQHFTKEQGQVHIHKFNGYVPPPPVHVADATATGTLVLAGALLLRAHRRRLIRA